ncbi:methyltransferase domain-containing protein [Candidatus Gracilibacteria bacterium]|nr:methyltransferase domain-containing protein [Candidatus Gracilibacteria bacterium]
MYISKSDILKLNDLVKNLEEFRQKLTEIDYIHNKKVFFDIMKDLRKYLLTIENQNLYKIFLHSKYYKFYKEFFTNINMYYVRSLESLQSISIMTKGIHNFDSFANLIDKDLIKQSFETKGNEIKSLNITSKTKTMVAVGCGSMPETLLYFYENTNIKNIIGVDYNHEAIFMAGEMISGLNLDKITFHQGDGVDYDYKEADIVYIPIFTSPKNRILNRIIETGKDDVQIIVIVPKGLGNLLYEGVGSVNQRLKIAYREDAFTKHIAQEVIKFVKYDF